ncbi:ABC transporter permease [Amnibacterium kyonggiense]|uniref:Putative ABC transport system permease protein n=1 Tax=Amnibacterium kyonggiense TaxID=595671 RepID=A0A4V3EAZ7_9MICO|nr:FtsX-like permease family protein [Amnibacterium kyonggiense]TDS79724.1 putative ABC transport system permease protein [Amnibacterium kyonggiense]
MIRLTLRELQVAPAQHVATLIVTSLGALFATIVIEADRVLASQSAAGGFLAHGFVRLLLDVLGSVFLFVAIFVSCIVIANTFGIVMTARARRIALLRLLGAEGRVLRRGVMLEGAIVGAAGGLLGTAIGVAVVAALIPLLTASGTFVPTPSPLVTPLLVAPALIGIASTTGAAWFGSGRVSTVTPLEAVGAGQEPTRTELRRRRRPWLVRGCLSLGTAMLVAGVAIGSRTPLGLFIAAPGGAVSFLGFVLGADAFLPPVLQVVGRLFGGSAPASLSRGNALRHPQRSVRSAVSLVIGVTLVVMFAVAAACFSTEAGAVAATAGPQEAASDAAFVTLVLGVLGVLIGFSLAIAAVGLVNSLSLSVLQRRREIGLLRAIGLERRQVRLMVLFESLQITLTGSACGLVLGVLYGWAAALTALSSDHHIGGYFLPTVPLPLVVAVVVSSALLAVVASLAPTRRATAVPPVAALAVD